MERRRFVAVRLNQYPPIRSFCGASLRNAIQRGSGSCWYYPRRWMLALGDLAIKGRFDVSSPTRAWLAPQSRLIALESNSRADATWRSHLYSQMSSGLPV